MAKLHAAQRNRIPSSKFGLPESRSYPMEDRAHAANAKSRATQMQKKGYLSLGQAKRIKAKANRVLDRDGDAY